jgi:hypothetical protein
VTADADLDEIVRAMTDYDLTFVPVVDEDERPIGIITPCKTRRRAAISDTREPAPLRANPHESAPSSRSW